MAACMLHGIVTEIKGTTSVVKKRTVGRFDGSMNTGKRIMVVRVKIELHERADSWWFKNNPSLDPAQCGKPTALGTPFFYCWGRQIFPCPWRERERLPWWFLVFFSNRPYINDANTVATEYRFYSTHGVRTIRTSNGAALSGSHSLRCHMHGNRNSRDLFFLSLVVLSF